MSAIALLAATKQHYLLVQKFTLLAENLLTKSIPHTPNIVAEWVATLLCIWDVPGSNLGPETGYPDRFSGVILITSRYILAYYLKLDHNHPLPYPCQFIIH
jgi:hypothetical protein